MQNTRNDNSKSCFMLHSELTVLWYNRRKILYDRQALLEDAQVRKLCGKFVDKSDEFGGKGDSRNKCEDENGYRNFG